MGEIPDSLIGIYSPPRRNHKTRALATAGEFHCPKNTADGLLRPLDYAVTQTVHTIRKNRGEQTIDTVKGVFVEGGPTDEGSGFDEKTHIQITVCNPGCTKGIFRAPDSQLTSRKRMNALIAQPFAIDLSIEYTSSHNWAHL